MTTLRTQLDTTASSWAQLGHPALLERFAVKHGQEFVGSPRPKGCRKLAMKMCFRNSTRGIDMGMDYYEGYAMRNSIGFPFLHAWNVKDGRVVDLTLRDPHNFQYLGMKFAPEQVWAEQLKSGVYGILVPGMINLDLLRSIDNDLVESALSIRRRVA